MWVIPISGTRILEHSVLTPLPARSALPGCRHLAPRGIGPQTVLCIGSCIELQSYLRPSEEANF